MISDENFIYYMRFNKFQDLKIQTSKILIYKLNRLQSNIWHAIFHLNKQHDITKKIINRI